MKELYDNLVEEAKTITGIDIDNTRTRSRDIVIVRACVSNVMTRVYGSTLTGVAKLMGHHHTTVLNHVQQHIQNQKYDDMYNILYERLSKHAVGKTPVKIDIDEVVNAMKYAFR